MMHILDSNTFIEAKNRYYGMAFCPAYWKWIQNQYQALEVASISFVADELKRGNDELTEWVKDNPELFLSVSDSATQQAFAQVAELVAGQAPSMKNGALEEFMSGADTWLIAKAMTSGAVVVTHESYNPANKKKFLIPNICKLFEIDYLNTFELLQKLDAKFILSD
jgi:hypothetical protein